MPHVLHVCPDPPAYESLSRNHAVELAFERDFAIDFQGKAGRFSTALQLGKATKAGPRAAATSLFLQNRAVKIGCGGGI